MSNATLWALFIVGFLFYGPLVQAEKEQCKPPCTPDKGCIKRGQETYICICRQGYNIKNDTCEDIDECQDKDGRRKCKNKGAKCINSPGSYACECPRGFEMGYVSHSCEDRDECNDDEEAWCHEFAYCENSKGSYRCSCKTGYAGDGQECVIDLALKHKKTVQMAILIGGAGGGAMLLITAVVIFCCCSKRIKKRKPGGGEIGIEKIESEYGQDLFSSDSDSDDSDL